MSDIARQLFQEKHQDQNWSKDRLVNFSHPHNLRQSIPLQLAVIVYSILHRFWPWFGLEHPVWDSVRNKGNGMYSKCLVRRRPAMNCDENLSQNCKSLAYP